MAHIVILGAGIGGMPMAYELRELLGDEHRITVVSDVPYFHFVPSNPWVAVNWRKRQDISFPIAPYFARKNIEFLSIGAKRLHPEESRVELSDGSSLAYDYVVIATGPRLAFEEVEGLGPSGHTHSVCNIDHAEAAGLSWNLFVENPGPIVVGAAQGASCFGPAYEFAFIMDTDLKRRRIRDRVPMTYVTPEPYIGHLGLGGVGDSKGLLESAMRERHIKWICNARITRVEAGKMLVAEHDEAGQLKKEHELPFSYSMMLPAFKGIDAVIGIDGLVNPRGFILIDEYQRNPRYRNVFAVGVCVAIPPIEATPIPVGAPKTGYMIESMVTAAAHNIQALLSGREPDTKPSLNALCLADFGDRGAAFVALPQIPPRNVTWYKMGRWVHWAKIAFEKYFIRKMKKGSTEPVYEKYVLKLMGINKLRSRP